MGGEFASGSVCASWRFNRTSSQRHVVRSDHSLIFIEGQPDRLPHNHEDIEAWLDGRSGSFRGFAITKDKARIFADPLGTRPVFFFEHAEAWCVADKLATISSNETEAQVNWPAVLEAAAIGSVYSSADTTLTNTRQLEPGECVIINLLTGEKRTRRFSLPLQDLTAAVRNNPAGSLLDCLATAVQETWNDPKTWLLISGGLDSRLTMALAGKQRNAITIDNYPLETGLAERIAKACGGSGFYIEEQSAAQYANRIRNGALIT